MSTTYGVRIQPWRSPELVGSELRLTRRGRLARTAAIAVVGVGLAVAVGQQVVGQGVAASTESGVTPLRTERVVVKQGDSLWSIAQRMAPGADPREVVTELRELNGLRSNLIHPGDVVLVPAIR